MASILEQHPPAGEVAAGNVSGSLSSSEPVLQPRQRTLSSASDSSIHSTESLADSSHSPEDEVATLSIALLEAINAGDRPRLAELLATGSPAAIEQVLATFTYPNTDKYYFHEPEILVDANALLGPATTRLNLIQIACFVGEEELALDIVNHLAREAESVGSKYALKALLGSMWGNGNTTLHLASFLGMADLVAKILEVHPALAKKANDRKVKPVDCTDDDVTRMHFFNTPEVNERIADNSLRAQSDSALGVLSSPTTRGRRSDSSASTTAPSRSILSGSRSIDNIKAMSNGANKKRVSFDPLTLWFQGAEQGDLAQLSLFLPCIESVDVRLSSRGATALHLACANGHLGAVKWILDHGADANAADDLGLTALHYAADGLHGALLLALIDDPRVDVDVTDDDGEGVLGAIDEDEEGGSQLLEKAEIALEVRRTKGPKQGPSVKLAAGDLVDLAVPAKPAVKATGANAPSNGPPPPLVTRIPLSSDSPGTAKPLVSALKSKPIASGQDQQEDPLSMSAPPSLSADMATAVAKSPPPVVNRVGNTGSGTPSSKTTTVSTTSAMPVPSQSPTPAASLAGASQTLQPSASLDPTPSTAGTKEIPVPASTPTPLAVCPPNQVLQTAAADATAQPSPEHNAPCQDPAGREALATPAPKAATRDAGPVSKNIRPAESIAIPTSLPAASAPLPNPSPSENSTSSPSSRLSTAASASAAPATTAVSNPPFPTAATREEKVPSSSPAPLTPNRTPSSTAQSSLSNSANSPKSTRQTSVGSSTSARPPSPYRLDLHPVASHSPSSLVAAAAAMYEQRASTSSPGGGPILPPVVSLSRAASLSVRSLTSSKPSAAELSVGAAPPAPASPGPDGSTGASTVTVSPSGKSRLGVKKEKRASAAASTAAMMVNAVEKVNSSAGKEEEDAEGGVDATPLASVSERRNFWTFASGRPAK